jgi:hypothetical protein
MKVKDWCEENKINRKTYYYWQKQVREAACQGLQVSALNEVAISPQQPTPVFSELTECNMISEITPPAGSVHAPTVTVRIGEIAVDVYRGADRSTIAEALRAVNDLC